MVKRFIKKDLICRYGMLAKLLADNAQNFNEKIIVKLYTKCKIKHFNSSLYIPKMNGDVEAANKNLQKKSRKWYNLQRLTRDASIRTLLILHHS